MKWNKPNSEQLVRDNLIHLYHERVDFRLLQVITGNCEEEEQECVGKRLIYGYQETQKQ